MPTHSAATPWQLTEHQAKLSFGGFAAQLDLTQPSLGLGQLSYEGIEVPASLLGVSIAGQPLPDGLREPVECYTRGADLVATYEPTDDRPVRFQVYWRAELAEKPVATPAAILLDATVSIQTPLLETYPLVEIGSTLASAKCDFLAVDGEQLFQSDPELTTLLASEQCGVLVAELADGLSYIEMVHPTDFVAWQLMREAPGLTCRTTWQMCDHLMEKGVLRRFRTRGVLCNDMLTPRQAIQQLSLLTRQELPLTV